MTKTTISGIKPLSKLPFEPFDIELDPDGINNLEDFQKHAIFMAAVRLGYKGLAMKARKLPDGGILCLYETDATSPEGVMMQGIANMIAEGIPLPKVDECIELLRNEYIHWKLDLPEAHIKYMGEQ